ncbi:MAG: WXG100 family type VII secretion target [Ruminococcus sp.]|nr:WXG100 family type VII secretion target [Ruminococcus sp.]
MNIIKADTQTLLNAAGEFSSEGSQVAALTSEMMQIVTGLACQWKGDAANMYINQFRQLEDDIQRMSGKITEFVEDLTSIANVYSTYEQSSMEAAAALETEVIS